MSIDIIIKGKKYSILRAIKTIRSEYDLFYVMEGSFDIYWVSSRISDEYLKMYQSVEEYYMFQIYNDKQANSLNDYNIKTMVEVKYGNHFIPDLIKDQRKHKIQLLLEE